MNRGKITILVILFVAICMGGIAWYYQFQRGQRLQKAWGMDNLLLIHDAPQVELIVLAEPGSPPSGPPATARTEEPEEPEELGATEVVESTEVEPAVAPEPESASGLGSLKIIDTDWPIQQQLDISQQEGLINARAPLVRDHSYLWTPEKNDRTAKWSFAIRFSDGGRQATLVFSTDTADIMLLGKNARIATRPKLMDSYRQFANAVVTLQQSQAAEENTNAESGDDSSSE